MWGNFFEFLSGESDVPRRKNTSTMKEERKFYWKEAEFEDQLDSSSTTPNVEDYLQRVD